MPPWDKPTPSPRAVARDLGTQIQAATLVEKPVDLAAKRTNIAVDQAALAAAPAKTVSAKVTAAVDQATQQATIDKILADSKKATAEAAAADLKSRYPELTQGQAVALSRYVNMFEGNKLYERAIKEGYRPSAFGNKITTTLDKIPLGQDIADSFRSPEAQEAVIGERTYKAGQLRSETGAAGPKEEGPEVRTRTFPSAFGPDDRKRQAYLREIRRNQMAAQRIGSGPGVDLIYPPPPPAALAKLREGVTTHFSNGQDWTLKGGTPQRVN